MREGNMPLQSEEHDKSLLAIMEDIHGNDDDNQTLCKIVRRNYYRLCVVRGLTRAEPHNFFFCQKLEWSGHNCGAWTERTCC